MGVIVVVMLASLSVAALFLGGFLWAVGSGQYDDTETPPLRVLMEEEAGGTGKNESGNERRKRDETT